MGTDVVVVDVLAALAVVVLWLELELLAKGEGVVDVGVPSKRYGPFR